MRRVLIVDDDASIREVVRLVLSDEGYDVAVAADGAQALAMLERMQPHVILLDMKMPHMDGWEFARRYRERYDHEAPIIVMTAAHDAARRGADIEADAIIPKPFDIDFLIARVDAIANDSAT